MKDFLKFVYDKEGSSDYREKQGLLNGIALIAIIILVLYPPAKEVFRGNTISTTFCYIFDFKGYSVDFGRFVLIVFGIAVADLFALIVLRDVKK